MPDPQQLSRRERQIMDVVYTKGAATAGDVLRELPDKLSNAAVRTFLRILEDKGHLAHRKRGREFVYYPTQPSKRVGRSALRRVLDVFFNGSLTQAVAAHLSDPRDAAGEEEVKRLSELIEQSRKQGKP
jgi:BlaI family transcriptional regulator, penicillinase repressor